MCVDFYDQEEIRCAQDARIVPDNHVVISPDFTLPDGIGFEVRFQATPIVWNWRNAGA